MKKFIVIAFLITIGNKNFGQVNTFQRQQEIDSLVKELTYNEGDKKIKLLKKITEIYLPFNPVLAEKYSHRGLEVSLLNKDTVGLINFYNYLGNIKHYSSQYDSAVYYNEKALFLSEIINDQRLVTICKINLAMVFDYHQEYQRALNIYKSTIPIIKAKNDSLILGQVYNNIGIAFRGLNEPDSAIKYGREAVKIQLSMNDQVNAAVTFTNMGQYHIDKNDEPKAEEYYKKALKIFKTHKNSYSVGHVSYDIARLYHSQKKYKLAEIYLHKVIKISKKCQSIRLEADASGLLSEIYEESTNLNKALLYYKDFKNLNDSILKKKHGASVKEIKNSFLLREQENQLKLLNNEVVIKRNKITLLSILLASFVVLISLIIIFYIRLSQKNKTLFKQSLKTIELPETNSPELLSPAMEELLIEITLKFEKEKIYLDSTLTISKLSDLLKSNSSYISKCINYKYHNNFNAVLNMYRVQEAKQLLNRGALKKYTLAAIGEKCGFTSISVFNRSFKKETGITPSYFAKSIKS